MGDGAVGIDLEEITAFDRFDRITIVRASARWLSPAERAWCAKQFSLARAFLVVLCCREAAFKSSGRARPAHELALRMNGDLSGGRGDWYHGGLTGIEGTWRLVAGKVLALAVAGDPVVRGGLCQRSN